MLETAAEGKAVKGRVAVGAQVADGSVLVAGRRAGWCWAGWTRRCRGSSSRPLPDWPSPGARAGPSASNPALDRPFALPVLLCLDARSCFQYRSLA